MRRRPVAQPFAAEQVEQIVASIRDLSKLRGAMAFEAPGIRADSDKVIEVRRDYS